MKNKPAPWDAYDEIPFDDEWPANEALNYEWDDYCFDVPDRWPVEGERPPLREGQIATVEELAAIPVGTIIQWRNDEHGICCEWIFKGIIDGERMIRRWPDWPAHLSDQECYLSDMCIVPYKRPDGERWNRVNWIRRKP
jgi:hypothetical protein